MITEFKKFLTEQECEILIALGESGQLRSGRTKGNKLGYRKAKVRWFNDHPLVNRIKSDVAKFSKIDLKNQEDFHFVKYEPGGEYKQHHDGSHRVKTALIYLNTGFTGGETFFPKVNLKIKPEIGKLIIWENLDSEGNVNKDSTHAGLPVDFGTKYIAVIWIKK